MNYLDALRSVHAALSPRFYVEIGCREGASLALARCPRLAIDPEPEISTAQTWPTRIYRETSDAFFARPDAAAILGQRPDLAFIDGMHLVEFALRDFLNLEAHSHKDTVIVIDDVAPDEIAWASRSRETRAWTGDVYRLIPLLRRYRPDLDIAVFEAEIQHFGKGLAVISGLDPDNRVLAERYEAILADLEGGAFVEGSALAIRGRLRIRPSGDLAPHLQDLAARHAARPDPAPASAPTAAAPDSTGLYLDLLKRSLLNEIYLDDELRLLYLRACLAGDEAFDAATYHDIRAAQRDRYRDLQASREIGRFPGRDIRKMGFSHSMMGRKRMDSLQACLDIVRENDVPGDVMECGVWRGGACIFMAGYLRAHGLAGRRVLVADSFDGLPAPTHAQDAKLHLDKAHHPELAIPQEVVEENFAAYGLSGDAIVFLKGWFRDTLASAPTDRLALLRLDGDLYESTMDALTALYDKVAEGGIVIVDDFGALKPCEQAVRDFFDARGEAFPQIETIDWTGAYWIKQPPQIPQTPGRPEPLRSFQTPFPEEVLLAMQAGVLRYSYKGIRCWKSPLDMAIYLKLLWDLKPRTIIEVGSKFGGSAVLFADIAQIYGLDAHVYSIDLEPPGIVDPRITFLQGDVNHLERSFADHGLGDCPRPWYVNEDSAHTHAACLAALKVLAREMQKGDVLAMEDGNLVQLGLAENYQGGPNRAIADFFQENPDAFEIATDLCDMFGTNATYNPNGYLRKT